MLDTWIDKKLDFSAMLFFAMCFYSLWQRSPRIGLNACRIIAE
jgi:hypothetical protein